jgi:SAM-dependent methyltransferase
VWAPLLRWVDRTNAAHPWSHNDHYRRWLLRQLPSRVKTALDVGCGSGNLVRALSARADQVTGIDPDAPTVALAESLSSDFGNVEFRVQSLSETSGGPYDAVTAVAVLHHLELGPGLRRLRELAKAGGRILIVGCYRAEGRIDRLLDLVAIPANLVAGLLAARHAEQARIAMSAPVTMPMTTLAEIRAAAAQHLPGARITRRLFWRYTLRYDVPGHY